MSISVQKIISGCQTGVDRAALDVAIAHHIPYGGWCPKGRRAEDGIIPVDYILQETPTGRYAERTEWNVRDSDGTLIIAMGPLEGGTLLTQNFARALNKPYFIFNVMQPSTVAEIIEWIKRYHIHILNVAGPRASKQPTLYAETKQLLTRLLVENIEESD